MAINAEYTREQLERLAEAKLDERIVKHGGLVVYEKQAYWTSKELVGRILEML